MRRWNGWGEESEAFAIPPGAAKDLAQRIGEATPPRDAARADVVASVPEPVLPKHPLIASDGETRLLPARGQSLPDWIALRSGRIDLFPDGVAFPESEDHFVSLLAFAKETGAVLVPYGGGTSVAGHVNPQPGPPTVTVSMARKSALASLDPLTRLATFGAGATGPQVEAALAARGFTLGHFPQSFEYSTLGGWILTRS